MSDAELLEIWERGASVYYDDHLAFARAVSNAATSAERQRCAKFCEELAADRNPPHKLPEETYSDGWLDACNECMWQMLMHA